MVRFICLNCEFRFESKEVKEKCPYCGESGEITKEKTASELICEAK